MGILVSMIAILILIAPIIVVAMIVSAIVKKKNNETNKSFFEDTIRAIYVYIVLICALCAIIGGVISTFNYGLDVFLPEEEYEETELSKERERNENIVHNLKKSIEDLLDNSAKRKNMAQISKKNSEMLNLDNFYFNFIKMLE